MRKTSVQELKQELQQLPARELTELCLRLAKFKKENKELLGYLLFESHDEASFVQSVCGQMDLLFAEVNLSHVFFAKKTLRKILRLAKTNIRYAGKDTVEIELLLHYCQGLLATGLAIREVPVLNNLFQGQIRKIESTLSRLHEDLQYDYRRRLEALLDT